MRRNISTVLVALAALALVVGCSKKSDDGGDKKPANDPKKPAIAKDVGKATNTPTPKKVAPTPTPTPTATVSADPAGDARKLFKQRCVVCHGASGKGDGAGAKNLNPKPRDYSDAKWQASVKDADIAAIIVKGGAALKKSNLMPPNPDLAAKPKVLAEMVKLIRGFAKK